MNQEKNRVVYLHINKITREVFYVGAGYINRPYVTKKRHKSWYEYVSKNEYEIQIVAENISEFESHCRERNLISFYGRLDLGTGPLVNKTDGGKGGSGRLFTKEQRLNCSRRMSERFKGKTLSKEHIEKIAKARTKKVSQYDLHGNFIKNWESASIASLALGIDKSSIQKACKGIYPKSGGYIWKYTKQ